MELPDSTVSGAGVEASRHMMPDRDGVDLKRAELRSEGGGSRSKESGAANSRPVRVMPEASVVNPDLRELLENSDGSGWT